MSADFISVFDMFKIGVGPSSSHTMGPWRAAQLFLRRCRDRDAAGSMTGLRAHLYGSLAKTGIGHGTDLALLSGLMGEDPETCVVGSLQGKADRVRAQGCIYLKELETTIPFDPSADLLWHRDVTLPYHPNGLRFVAGWKGGPDLDETYYSVGGGFVTQEGDMEGEETPARLSMPVRTSKDLLRFCRERDLTIPEVVRQNELCRRGPSAIRNGIARIWKAMRESVYRGCHAEGILPGGLGVIRRAAGINRRRLVGVSYGSEEEWFAAIRDQDADFQEILKWVICFALAVNEENAAFGRVVTAPTNGAAGVIPSTLMYLLAFVNPNADLEAYFLAAGQIGVLFKSGATISAAMGGCQAEIGVSSAMAAAGLTQCMGGTPEQVLMAAEIAMEHHLGLTCDPVSGLVQVPCIERNAMGAVKAITACQIALESDPKRAKVSLDAVIRVMWETALEMNAKYKETSEGGLAINIPVSLSEC